MQWLVELIRYQIYDALYYTSAAVHGSPFSADDIKKSFLEAEAEVEQLQL